MNPFLTPAVIVTVMLSFIFIPATVFTILNTNNSLARVIVSLNLNCSALFTALIIYETYKKLDLRELIIGKHIWIIIVIYICLSSFYAAQFDKKNKPQVNSMIDNNK